MKKKYLAYAILPVMAVSVLGIGLASANGGLAGWFGGMGFMGSTATPEQIAQRQTTLFQNEAALLGIDIAKVKDGWAQGKTLQQIAQDNGITGDQLKQKIADYQKQQLTNYLNTLVSQGVITQAQADSRLQFMQQHMTGGKAGKGLGFGFGRMMR